MKKILIIAAIGIGIFTLGFMSSNVYDYFNPEETYNYECEVDVWGRPTDSFYLDPEHNDFPEFHAQEKYFERSGFQAQPEDIKCTIVIKSR